MKARKRESKVSFLKNGLLAAILVFFVFVAFSATASAAVINVPSAGNETIQQAINNASAGDTIYVWDGTYNENVDIGKAVTLIGNGTAVTIVNASNPSDHVFEVTVDYVNISGFTVENATGSWKAGIYLDNVNHCNISNNNATNNNCGIYLASSSNNNNITGNNAYNNNYGIYLSSSSNNNITGNNVSNNNNDGIVLISSSNNNHITGNNASNNNNDGIRLSYSSSVNNNITGNTANNNRDGISLYESGSNNNITSNNASNNNKEGIRLRYSSYNTITGNNASNNNRYGIYLSDSSSNNNISYCNLSNNNIDINVTSSSGNIFYRNTFSSYPTMASFEYSGDFAASGVESIPPTPAAWKNISKALNMTNLTTGTWVDVSIYYSDSDIPSGQDENLLEIQKHNESWLKSGWDNGKSLDTINNIVTANITDFSSIFAPLLVPPPHEVWVNDNWTSQGDVDLYDPSLIWQYDAFDIIHDGIDAVVEGGIAHVLNGIYQETVVVNKSNIVIRSENGSANCIVSANGASDHVFNITDQINVTIEGFTIRDAYGTTQDVAGIYLNNASECNISDNSVTNISATGWNAIGIYLDSSSNNNSFYTSTVYNLSAGGDAYGIYLSSSSNNNSFHTSTVYNLSSAYNAYGIYLLSSSDNNSFSSGSISDINAPDWWDFYSDGNSHRNSAENITISSYPTTISFTYDNGIKIKSVENPPQDPAGKVNISKYVNATNVTANSWLFLNVSYDESDVSTVCEYCLKMYRHNGTAWEEVPGGDVNTAENYVWANITEFSIFAPLGGSTATIPTATGTGNVTINTSSGYFCNETDALPTSPPGPPALTFPHGFFNITICGLNDTYAENVTINFTFPSAIPTNAEFWKYNSSNKTWYPYPFDSNDGDNVISITITDNNATGDHNPALGVINDPNGVGWPAAAAKVPALTPIGMIALVGLLSVVLAVSISIRIRRKK